MLFAWLQIAIVAALTGYFLSVLSSLHERNQQSWESLVAQLNAATFTFSPSAGIGSTNAPFNGTLSGYIDQVLTTQGAAAASAKSLSDGQDVVVNSLQQSFNSATGVNIYNEMASLLALQNAYTANARVLTTINQMFTTLQQAFA